MISTALVIRAKPPAEFTFNGDPLAFASQRYLAFKKKRLTKASERSYKAALRDFADHYPELGIKDLEPPRGSALIEDFLVDRYGHLAPRTYNRGMSVLADFMRWLYARGELHRDPTLSLERAKPRQVHRTTFTDEQRTRILAANPDPRDLLALRLLLDYGLRKGALRNVQLEHFDVARRQLTIFTKGEKIFTLQVPTDALWELLAQIKGPGSDYLLPKQTTRKRTPPKRKALQQLDRLLTDARAALEEAADDEHCARELALCVTNLDATRQTLTLTIAAASTRVTREPAIQCGEHGTHLWWYRCLTRAGIVEPGTTSGERLHKARHTAGQRILEKTGNLKATQKALTHATISTTGDVYTDWDDQHMEQTMRDVVPS